MKITCPTSRVHDEFIVEIKMLVAVNRFNLVLEGVDELSTVLLDKVDTPKPDTRYICAVCGEPGKVEP